MSDVLWDGAEARESPSVNSLQWHPCSCVSSGAYRTGLSFRTKRSSVPCDNVVDFISSATSVKALSARSRRQPNRPNARRGSSVSEVSAALSWKTSIVMRKGVSLRARGRHRRARHPEDVIGVSMRGRSMLFEVGASFVYPSPPLDRDRRGSSGRAFLSRSRLAPCRATSLPLQQPSPPHRHPHRSHRRQRDFSEGAGVCAASVGRTSS